MGKYVKRPVVIDAFQWFKNGDHPEDACVELTGSDGQPFMSEGKVVRYFRRPEPEYAGTIVHEACGRTWHDHGWIDTLEGGHTVCPGDFIITGVRGERYPCKPDIFVETYEAAESDEELRARVKAAMPRPVSVYDSYHQDGVPGLMPTAEEMEAADRRLAERYDLPPEQRQRLAETREAVLACRTPVAPLDGKVTDDPNDPAIRRGVDTEQTQQHEKYLVLSVEEREKGYVRPVRLTYVHTKCGVATSMGRVIAETYARDPKFYGSTYCMGCRMHLPVAEFKWEDGSVLGS